MSGQYLARNGGNESRLSLTNYAGITHTVPLVNGPYREAINSCSAHGVQQAAFAMLSLGR